MVLDMITHALTELVIDIEKKRGKKRFEAL